MVETRRAGALREGRRSGRGATPRHDAWLSERLADAQTWFILLGVISICSIAVVVTRIMSNAPVEVGLDGHVNCQLWAASGECARNPMYMRSECHRSCQGGSGPVAQEMPSWRATPQTHWTSASEQFTRAIKAGPTAEVNLTSIHSREQCEAWRKGGDCETCVSFMQLHCAAVCKYGPPDRDKNCPVWAQNGECQGSPAFMRLQCPSSCGPFFAFEGVGSGSSSGVGAVAGVGVVVGVDVGVGGGAGQPSGLEPTPTMSLDATTDAAPQLISNETEVDVRIYIIYMYI
ncbi:hypothetical protein T492DRAFT_195142 [Pavlovales sp. CCMP2436]|nr:hypothetical protein T492DRAFT_195142 [Pavlovales sp. CCMP2436]